MVSPSPNHRQFYAHIDALTPGVKPDAFLLVLPRGGGKTTTCEFAVSWLAESLRRRYALYIMATQDQADERIAAISARLERLGIKRSVTRYGASRGWRRNQLRTADGFNVAAMGLDTSARGTKADDYRPDLIILDDIDDSDDRPRQVQRKIRRLTETILPMGSSDCAVVFAQNLIHDGSIMNQLVTGAGEFLLNRVVTPVARAVDGLTYEMATGPDGRKRFRITGGTPTWEGQTISICEQQMNERGPAAFLREAQQMVEAQSGAIFDHKSFQICPLSDVPEMRRVVLACDLAATEGRGDYTVVATMGEGVNGFTYVLDVRRYQMNPTRVQKLIRSTCEYAWQHYECPEKSLRLPLDPGQAGIAQSERFETEFSDFNVRCVRPIGNKVERAAGWINEVNGGNAVLVRADWNHAFIREHREFSADMLHEHDDQVDACADGYEELKETSEIETMGIGHLPPDDPAPWQYKPAS